MFIMIEKVSFESALPSLRRANNNIMHSNHKPESAYFSDSYMLAALAGLAVIGMGCLFGKNKNVGKTIEQTANYGKKIIKKSAADVKTGTVKPVFTAPSSFPEKQSAVKLQKNEDIDLKYLNAKERNLVNTALEEYNTTPQMQADYNNKISFQPLKQDEKTAFERLKENNKAQNQDINTLGTNLPQAVYRRLKSLFPPLNDKQKAMIIPINSGFPRRFTA